MIIFNLYIVTVYIDINCPLNLRGVVYYAQLCPCSLILGAARKLRGMQSFVIIIYILDQAVLGINNSCYSHQKKKKHRARKDKSKAMDTFSQEEKNWAKVGLTDPTSMNQIINEQIVEQIGQDEVVI